MRFVYPWFLLLISIVPVMGSIWFWLFRRSQNRLALLISPALQTKLAPPRSTLTFLSQLALTILGLTLLAVAAARPQWGRRDEMVFSRGRNILIALDVSRSMLAQDVHPNRLERAKTDLMDLIGELRGDRAGLVAFRRTANLICPLTTDYTFLRQALDGTTPDSAPRGETNLGDAIRKSLDALDSALDEYNAILMISDGEDLRGGALEAAQEAARRNIPIFTVGIGDEDGATIPDPDGTGVQQHKGTTVKTRLMSETLTAIANASNGRYIPLGTAGTAHTTLGSIYRNHLRTIAAKEQQEMLENRYRERYQLFLIPGLLFLLAAATLSRGRLSGSRTRQTLATATLTLLLCTTLTQGQTLNPQGQTLNPQGQTLHPAQGQTLHPQPQPTVPQEVVSTNTPTVKVAPGRAGARQAQSWLKRGKYQEAAAGFVAAARGADPDEADSYRYNAAIAYYHAENFEAAIQLLRPLLHSRRLAPQAGELLGKIQLERSARLSTAQTPATTPEEVEKQAVDNLAWLKESALGFQQSLRHAPSDERSQRNLYRATDHLATARENAHIAKVLKEHGETPPNSLLQQMLNEQRQLIEDLPGIHTNEAALKIKNSESLAKRQDTQSDLWIPLKQHLIIAVTNQQQQAQLLQQVELTRDAMRGSATALRDLLPEAEHEVTELEPVIYNFWQMVALPPALIDEDITAQTNTITSLPNRYLKNRNTQPQALQLTQAFRERFPSWAEQYQQQAQSDTNMPPFTAEDQAKIAELAEHTERLQSELLDPQTPTADYPPLREQALKNLLEIRELLPKDNSSSQSSDQQQPQQQDQDQQQEQQNEDQEQEQPPEPQDQQEEQQEEPEPEPQEQPETPQDVQELLRKALEREKEHEEEKKRQMRTIPLAPGERDW